MADAAEQIDIREVLSGEVVGWNDVLAEIEQQSGAQRRSGPGPGPQRPSCA